MEFRGFVFLKWNLSSYIIQFNWRRIFQLIWILEWIHYIYAFLLWTTNLWTQIMWWKPFACAHTLLYVFKAMYCSCICVPPRLRSNLEGPCSTRCEGDDDSRQLATLRRSTLVFSWLAVSPSWARHGQTAGACQLEVLQQGKRRSTENSYYFKGRSVNGL